MDGIGGNCKLIVQRQMMSKGANCIIVQNAKDFAEAAARLVPTIHVIYIPQSVIDEKIFTVTPFTRTIPIHGIFRMHVSSYPPGKRFNCGKILDMFPNRPTFPSTSKLELTVQWASTTLAT